MPLEPAVGTALFLAQTSNSKPHKNPRYAYVDVPLEPAVTSLPRLWRACDSLSMWTSGFTLTLTLTLTLALALTLNPNPNPDPDPDPNPNPNPIPNPKP